MEENTLQLLPMEQVLPEFEIINRLLPLNEVRGITP